MDISLSFSIPAHVPPPLAPVHFSTTCMIIRLSVTISTPVMLDLLRPAWGLVSNGEGSRATT